MEGCLSEAQEELGYLKQLNYKEDGELSVEVMELKKIISSQETELDDLRKRLSIKDERIQELKGKINKCLGTNLEEESGKFCNSPSLIKKRVLQENNSQSNCNGSIFKNLSTVHLQHEHKSLS